MFQTHQVYPDDLVLKLAEAASAVLSKDKNPQSYLHHFGRYFVSSFCIYGYDKIIKVRK